MVRQETWVLRVPSALRTLPSTVCTRPAGAVSRAHPSGTICRILLLFPSLSTTGVSYMVLQETLVLQVPSALHTLPSTVCTRPAGAVSRAHPAETIWRILSFSLRSPPPGCRRHPRSADRRTPTMSPPLYLSVSFPRGIVSSCTPTVQGARYASSVVQPQSGCARAVMQPLPQGSLRAFKGHGASRSHGSREGPKVLDCCTPAPFWRPFW